MRREIDATQRAAAGGIDIPIQTSGADRAKAEIRDTLAEASDKTATIDIDADGSPARAEIATTEAARASIDGHDAAFSINVNSAPANAALADTTVKKEGVGGDVGFSINANNAPADAALAGTEARKAGVGSDVGFAIDANNAGANAALADTEARKMVAGSDITINVDVDAAGGMAELGVFEAEKAVAGGDITTNIDVDAGGAVAELGGYTAASAGASASSNALTSTLTGQQGVWALIAVAIGAAAAAFVPLLGGLAAVGGLAAGAGAGLGIVGAAAYVMVNGLYDGGAAFGQLSAAANSAWQQVIQAVGPIGDSIAQIGIQALSVANNYIPMLGVAGTSIAGELTSSFGQFFDALNQESSLADFQTILSGTAPILGNLVTAAGSLVDALLHIFAVATPAAVGLSGVIMQLAVGFDNWVNSAQGTSSIASAIQVAIPVFSALWGAVVDITGAIIDFSLVVGPDMATAFSVLGSVIAGAVQGLTFLFSTVGSGNIVFAALGVAVGLIAVALAPVVAAIAGSIGLFAGVTAAVIAFATSASAVYQYWETVGPFLQTLWSSILSGAQAAWGAIEPIVSSAINAVLSLVQSVGGQITSWWEQHGATIRAAAQNAWTAVQAVVAAVMPVISSLVSTGLGALVGIVSGIWTAVSGVVQGGVDAILGIITVFSGLLSGNWSEVWSGLTQIAGGIWTAISGVVQGGVQIVISVLSAALSTLSTLWSAGWSALVAVVSPILSRIASVVTTVFTAIVSTIGSLLQSGVTTVTTVFTAIVTVIGTLLAEAVTVVTTVFTTVVTTIGSLLQGAVSIVTSIFTAIYTVIVGILTQVVAYATMFGTILLQVFVVGLALIVGTVAIILTPLIDLFTTIFTAIYTVVSTIVSEIATFLSTAWTEIVAVVAPIVTALWTMISTAFQTGVSWIQSIMQTVWSVLTTIWQSVYDTVSPIVQALWDFIIAGMQYLADTETAIMQTIWDFLVSAWQGIYDTISPLVQALWDFIVQAWTDISTQTSTIFQAVWDFLSSTWQSIYDTVSSLVQQVLDFIVQAWTSVSDETTSIFQAIWDFLSSTWQSIYDTVTPIVQSVYDFVSSTWDSVASYTTDIFTQVGDFLSSTWQSIYDDVSGIIQSLVDFLSSSWDGIVSTATAFGTALYDAVYSGFATAVGKGGQIMAGLLSGAADALDSLGVGADIAGSLRDAASTVTSWTTFADGGVVGFAEGGGSGGMGTGQPQARMHLWNEQMGPEAYIAKNGPRRANLGYLQTAASWFGGKVVSEDQHAGGVVGFCDGGTCGARCSCNGSLRFATGGVVAFASGGGEGLGATHWDVEPYIAERADKIAAAVGGSWNTYYGHGEPGGSWESVTFDVWGPGGRGDPLYSSGIDQAASMGISYPDIMYAIANGEMYRSSWGGWQPFPEDPHYDHCHLSYGGPEEGGGGGYGGGGIICRSMKAGFQAVAGPLMDAAKGAMQALAPPPIAEVGGYVVDKGGQAVIDWIVSSIPGCGSTGAGGTGSGSCFDVVDDAIKRLGFDASYKQPTEEIIQRESGGDPAIENAQGSGATGCMQFMPETFDNFAEPGCTNIKDAMCNVMAGLKYQQYLGGPGNFYHEGGVIPGRGDKLVFAEGGERVLTAEQNKNLEVMARGGVRGGRRRGHRRGRGGGALGTSGAGTGFGGKSTGAGGNLLDERQFGSNDKMLTNRGKGGNSFTAGKNTNNPGDVGGLSGLGGAGEMGGLTLGGAGGFGGGSGGSCGAGDLCSGMDNLDSGMSDLGSGMSDLGGGTSDLGSGMGDLGAGESNLGSGMDQLGGGMGQLGTGTSDLGMGTSNLGSGMSDMSTGMDQLGTGTGDLGTGMSDLGTGTSDLGTGESNLGGGMSDLGSGTDSLGSGMDSLGSGMSDLSSGMSDVGSGMDCGAGSGDLCGGMSSMGSGMSDLGGGMSDLAGSGGGAFNSGGNTSTAKDVTGGGPGSTTESRQSLINDSGKKARGKGAGGGTDFGGTGSGGAGTDFGGAEGEKETRKQRRRDRRRQRRQGDASTTAGFGMTSGAGIDQLLDPAALFDFLNAASYYMANALTPPDVSRPLYHEGGVVPGRDDQEITVQGGERVLSRKENRDYERDRDGGRGHRRRRHRGGIPVGSVGLDMSMYGSGGWLGWDLISGGAVPTEIDTQWYDGVTTAMDTWNAAGSPAFRESGSPSLWVYDEYAGVAGAAAVTNPDGSIYLDPDAFAAMSYTNQLSAITHELGHAIGLDHTTEYSIMNYDYIYDLQGSLTDYDVSMAQAAGGGASAEKPGSEDGDGASGGPGGGGNRGGGGGGRTSSYNSLGDTKLGDAKNNVIDERQFGSNDQVIVNTDPRGTTFTGGRGRSRRTAALSPYHDGGVVPGPGGSENLFVAEAGERVLTVEQNRNFEEMVGAVGTIPPAISEMRNVAPAKLAAPPGDTNLTVNVNVGKMGSDVTLEDVQEAAYRAANRGIKALPRARQGYSNRRVG